MTQPRIITHQAVWINTGDAVDWLKFANPDAQITLYRVDGRGVQMEVQPADMPGKVTTIGILSPDLVGLAKYLLAVAAAQGVDLKGAPSV